jgi:plasmid stabilization system protein ParE
MKPSLERSQRFSEDFDAQFRWYLEHAGEQVAERFLNAGPARRAATSSRTRSSMTSSYASSGR